MLRGISAEESEESLLREFLNARKERGVETDKKLKDNFKELWGEKEYVYNTGYIFLERAVGLFPPPARKMDKFGDYRFAADLQLFCQVRNETYLKEKYRPSNDIVPLRFILSQNIFLHDILYWEWKSESDGIQLRKLETGSGMILSIIPKNLDVKKGISNKDLKELLLKVTEIPPIEIKNMIQKSPPILKEGVVFSNVENLKELVNAKQFTTELESKFPFPHEEDEWSRQLVGFISKDAICLIIVHQVSISQNVNSDPVIIEGSLNWLSGRILQKDGKPVLPRGLKKMPEHWKPILEENARLEQVQLKIEEENRIEEMKWRVWHDKDGKPLNNGAKMRFEYWSKPKSRPFDLADDLPYKDGVVELKTRVVNGDYIVEQSVKIFSLSQFSKEDQKQIMSVPPMKQNGMTTQPICIGRIDEHGNLVETNNYPKQTEPEPDDIE
ncbi:MAG: hypothetical protein LBB88_09935 [Planctomycetaceae bacterium]|jgi:hypothetical protein|nr:hypothetical protein [Planctomycetaceae bacterium]